MSNMLGAHSALSIIKALGGNPTSGMCRCPTHDDNTASLHVTEKNDRVLVKCHAGCSQDAVIGALRDRGLWASRSSSATPRSKPKPDDDASKEDEQFRKALAIMRAAARYEIEKPKQREKLLGQYLRGRGIDDIPEAASLLSATDSARLTGRRFPAMVTPIVGDGKLKAAQVTFLSKDGSRKLNTDPRKMYGRMKGGYVCLGTCRRDKPLILAEGIETALSASQITDLPSIAALSAVNMRSVSLPECSEVIIAADNDDAGRKAAKATAQALASIGRKVRIAFPVKPDGVEKYDWNDALRSGANVDELRETILGAKRFKESRIVRALPVEDFMSLNFPERDYLMKPWLTRSSLAMIHAQRGAAKTWLALSVAYAVATGKPLMNWNAGKAARVLYVDGELPGKLLQKRLKLLGPYTKNLLVLSRDLFHMRKALMPDLGEPAGREYLNEIIERYEIDLVILDSLSTLVRSGVENDAESWAPIQDWALEHRWRDRTILFVHHEGRAGKPRGSSKREDVLDTMIGLRPRLDVSDNNESAFDLIFTKSREFYGADAAPLLVRLSVEDGAMEWSCELPRRAPAIG